MTYKKWLDSVSLKLSQAGIPSVRLDAELLLSFVLKKPRSYLLSHSDERLNTARAEKLDKLLKRRLNREPLAYIVGAKEFYGREFTVTPNVLVPRPESETIIELFKKHQLGGRVLDVGTGSGCIGLTLKAEYPSINLTVSDISQSALEVARKNAKKLSISPVRYIRSDILGHWLSHNKPKKFDVIVANLPYVDKTWDVSPETTHEPRLALFSDDTGMQHTKRLFTQANQLLPTGGHLIIEADPRQHKELSIFAKKHNFQLLDSDNFICLYTLQA